MRKPLLAALFALTGLFPVLAQQTVGVLQHSAGSTDDGFVLLAPVSYTNTYLIDKCGREVHRWSSAYRAGQAAYLLPDGSLLRAGANTPLNAAFNAGGRGGIIERMDWNGAVMWSYAISSASECQHHDIKALPNGNVLALVWELKTAAEAAAAGRNASQIGAATWSEKLVELRPIGSNQATVVWEWHAWDHLVQEADPAKANYAPVAQHPELVHVNYNASAAQPDWLHFNAIDYNPALDQILLSVHGLNEVWVIDHSTTTAQAASHSGGASAHGGDLLYRWGNPAAYAQGTAASQKLFGQHNAHWLEAGLPYAGSIQIFNNGQGRPGGNSSSVDVITPSVNAAGQYSGPLPYGPTALTATYADATPTSFFAMNISGAQRLPNGNLLVCNGPAGRVFEVTSQGNKVWDYLSPVGMSGPVAQGSTPTQNILFRAPFYASSYAAFAGRALLAGAPLEVNPSPASCALVLAAAPATPAMELTVAPNPAHGRATVQLPAVPGIPTATLAILDALGRTVRTQTAATNAKTDLDLTGLPAGLYAVRVQAGGSSATQRLVVE